MGFAECDDIFGPKLYPFSVNQDVAIDIRIRFLKINPANESAHQDLSNNANNVYVARIVQKLYPQKFDWNGRFTAAIINKSLDRLPHHRPYT